MKSLLNETVENNDQPLRLQNSQSDALEDVLKALRRASSEAALGTLNRALEP